MTKNSIEKLFLWFIPLSVFILMIFFRKDIEAFYLSWVDPVYAYLFNGLNLARGEFSIGHTDHPGTPLQILSAIVIRLVFIFRNADSLSADVLAYPEMYLSAISYTLISLNVLMIGFSGHLIFYYTKRFSTALFLQLSPLIPVIGMKFMPIPTCESLLLICQMGLIAFFYLYAFANKNIKHKHFIVLFSLLTACCIATKVSSLPVLLIPLVLFDNKKSRLKYLLFTILFFIIFVIPVINKLDANIEFLKRIFTHTGKYGKGEKAIFDIELYLTHLKAMFTDEFPFTLIVLLYMFFVVHRLIFPTHFKNIKTLPQRLLFALSIATFLQILIVARHYSFHYLLPAYSFAALGFISLVSVYHQIVKSRIGELRIFKPTYCKISIFFLFFFLVARLIFDYGFFPDCRHPMKETVTFIEKHDNPQHIIFSNAGLLTSYNEPALYFGLSYSGNQKTYYRSLLKQIYPNVYFFSTSTNELYDWQTTYMKSEAFSNYDGFWLYLKGNNSPIPDIIKLYKEYGNDTLFQYEKIYENRTTGEYIFNLDYDKKKLRTQRNMLFEIHCDMEKINDGNKFISTDGNYLFEAGNLQSDEKSFAAKHSVKLDEKSPYAMKISLNPPKGAFIKISVWRYDETGKGLIVASGAQQSGFYKAGNIITQQKDGWQRIENNLALPNNKTISDFNIYLWYKGDTQAYFDDLKIQVFDR